MAIGTTAATLVSAGASVVGGMMSQDAQQDAASAQQQANQAAIAEQRRQFDKIVELNEPFRQTDIQAMNAQKDLLGLGGMGGGGSGAPAPGAPAPGGGQTPSDNPPQPGIGQVPGPNGPVPAIPGATGPEAWGGGNALRRYRGREQQYRENFINNVTDNPENRRVLLQRLAEQYPDNPFIQNALSNIGG